MWLIQLWISMKQLERIAFERNLLSMILPRGICDVHTQKNAWEFDGINVYNCELDAIYRHRAQNYNAKFTYLESYMCSYFPRSTRHNVILKHHIQKRRIGWKLGWLEETRQTMYQKGFIPRIRQPLNVITVYTRSHFYILAVLIQCF